MGSHLFVSYEYSTFTLLNTNSDKDMRKAKVTQDEVAAIADDLRRTGTAKPSAAQVRKVLEARRAPGEEVGSLSTIHVLLAKHLLAAEADAPPYARVEIPRQLSSAIEQALQDSARASREDVAARVAQLQEEARELATAGDAAEHRLGEALELLALRTTERDLALGQLKDQTAAAARLGEAVQSEQQACAEARLDLVRSQASTASASAHLAQMQVQADNATKELASLRERLHSEIQRRLDAEKRADAAELRGSFLESQAAGAERAKGESETRLRVLEHAATAAAAKDVVLDELRAQLAFFRRIHDRRKGKASAADEGQALPEPQDLLSVVSGPRQGEGLER